MATQTILVVALEVVYISILMFKAGCSLNVINKQKKSWKAGLRPNHQDVCIMQPILSGDPYLETILEHNIKDLSLVSFLFLVDTNDAEAIKITDKLKRTYPQRDLRSQLFCQAPDGVNPKTFKLDLGLKEVTSSTVVVLDDDTLLPRTTLDKLVHSLENAAVSTALPGYVMQGGIHSRLLASFVNNNSASTYLTLLPFVHPITINGMCYAFRTKDFRQIGGFAPTIKHLTDDLAVAQLIAKNKGIVAQCSAPVLVYTRISNWTHYCQQMHRWFVFALLLVKIQRFELQIGVVLLNSIHPILLWSIILLTIIYQANPFLLGFMLVFRCLVICLLNNQVGNCQRHAVCLSILSELLQPFHLLHALFVRSIKWRSRKYRVVSNSEFYQTL